MRLSIALLVIVFCICFDKIYRCDGYGGHHFKKHLIHFLYKHKHYLKKKGVAVAAAGLAAAASSKKRVIPVPFPLPIP